MWQKSPLFEELDTLCHFDNQNIEDTFHIIGESAYPMSNHLLVPYKTRGGSMTDAQKKFNTHLASRRAVIERAFGLLGLRFPRVTHLHFRSNKKRILCVVAACVLHNWCLIEDDDDETMFDLLDLELETDVNDTSADIELGRMRAHAGGVTKREMMCNTIQGLN